MVHEQEANRKEVTLLKCENEKMVKGKETFKNEVSRLKFENVRMVHELEANKNEVTLLKCENEKMVKGKEAIKNEVSRLKFEYVKMVHEQEANKNEVTLLKCENEKMVKGKEAIKNEITSLNDEAVDMERKLKYAHYKIVSLNNDNAIKDKELASALNEALQARKKNCKNCNTLRKLYEELKLECEHQDKFRRAQLNKIRLQADVYLQMANDHKWQNDVLRQRLNGLTLQSEPYKPP
ncbi:uncharacterized protein LOC144650256 isoform X5 [Oculina patagonica]